MPDRVATSWLSGYLDYLVKAVGKEKTAELIGIPEWQLATWLPPNERRVRSLSALEAQKILLAVAECKRLVRMSLREGKSYTSLRLKP